MAITIEAIKFNHNPTSSTTDALTIRKNENVEVRIPEWQRQESGAPLTSPAAYAKSQGNKLTIAVRLRRTSIQSDQSVFVSARSTGVLGSVSQKEIVFSPQQPYSDFEVLNLAGASIGESSVGKSEIIFDWTLRSSDSGTVYQTTKHLVYTLLGIPTMPWGQPETGKPGYQLPWTDVIEVAREWANGAATVHQAAAMITRRVNALGATQLRYDVKQAASHFTLPGGIYFNCSTFLELLAHPNTKALVNCTDCAVFVSSIGNILGCDLSQARMGADFHTNKIREIGIAEPDYTFFTEHEVAWIEPCTKDHPLFDSSLEVDGGANPRDDRFESPMLGIGIPLGDADMHYNFRLVKSGEMCGALLGTSTRRRIGGPTFQKRQLTAEVEGRLKKNFDFASWENIRRSAKHIFLSRYFQNTTAFSRLGWQRQLLKTFAGEDGAPDVTETIWQSDSVASAVLRVLIYECRSLTDAHSFLLNLLDEFELPIIKRRNDLIIDGQRKLIGDVAFSDPDDVVVLFARANVGVVIQNEGSRMIPVSQFANEIDLDIINNYESDEFSETDVFSIPHHEFFLGDEVPIQIRPPADTEAFNKILAVSGELFRKNGQVFYRPLESGHQSMTAFTFAPGEKRGRQILSLLANPLKTIGVEQGSSTTSNQKEKKAMAFNFLGKWTSIRPNRVPNQPPETPLDMRPDGTINIMTFNEATGAVLGEYKEGTRTVQLEGTIRFSGFNSYAFVFRHEDVQSSNVKFTYEGLLVAADPGDPTTEKLIVAGRFRVDPGENKLTNQDEGVWVATKP